MDQKRLLTLIKQFQPSIHTWELEWLIPRVEALNPKIIIEIGIFKGGSLSIWREILGPNGLLIGIDPSNRTSKMFPIKFVYIKGRSDHIATIGRVMDILDGRSADFVFVDGDHGIPHLDYKNYFPFLREGGAIGFHDHKLTRKYFGRFDKVIKWDNEEFLAPNNFIDPEDGKKKTSWGVAMIWKRKTYGGCEETEK